MDLTDWAYITHRKCEINHGKQLETSSDHRHEVEMRHEPN